MTHYKTSLNKLAEHTNSNLVGDGSAIVDSISTIQNAQSGSITFLSNNKYSKYLAILLLNSLISGKILIIMLTCWKNKQISSKFIKGD